jgi:uncharacterized repeat protein (TIGR04042 family)
MPEVSFTLRWPDGIEQRCTSPSTVIHEHLMTGTSFTVGEFVERTAMAMDAASERVRARYGFTCTGAAEQQAAIARSAARYDPHRDVVTVVSVG